MALDVTLGGAFLAGLVSFVSPCVLPIVPPSLCFLAGVSLDELTQGGEQVGSGLSRRVLKSAAAFVLGFTTVFVGFGATASVIGRTLAWHRDTLSVVSGIIIVVMGLHFLGVFRLAWLAREVRFQVARAPTGLLGAYVVGLAFAFGWTPCIGPVLSAVLATAGGEDTAARGATLLAAYSLGIGSPFLAAAAFAGPFLAFAKGVRRHMVNVERAMGGLLVMTGILFLTGQMTRLSYWLLEMFPSLAQIG